MNRERKQRVLIVGAHGGTASSLLSLLTTHSVGERVLEKCEQIFLLDKKDAQMQIRHPLFTLLPSQAVATKTDIERLITTYQLTHIIDLSSLNSIDCILACEARQVHFLSTSVEEWAESTPVATDKSIQNLVAFAQTENLQGSYLIGSGANPGWVNALVSIAKEEFLRKVPHLASVEDLGIKTILITEIDTTAERGVTYSKDLFPITWSPHHCLEELLEPKTFYTKSGGEVVSLKHAPVEALYEARCGEHIIQGMLVPHEETLTLSLKNPGVEFAFIYRLPEIAFNAVARVTGDEVIKKNFKHHLIKSESPQTELSGYDRLGVLLCTERYGELWMGFHTECALAQGLAGNATQFQVAAGVLAGWHQLGKKQGVHFVEDLNSALFVEDIVQILGPMSVHYNPNVSYRSILARQLQLRSELNLAVG